MIDYILAVLDEATAFADPVAAGHYTTDAQSNKIWNGDHVQTVTVWQASQDTIDNTDPQHPITVHHPLAGYWLWVSWPAAVSVLLNHTALKVAINRDALNARTGGGILRQTVGNPILQDCRISPVYAGCDFNWGGLA